MKSTLAMLLLAVVVVGPAMAGDTKDDIVAMEKASWKAWGDHDVKTYTGSMTEDAVQISSSGEVYKGREKITALVGSHKCIFKGVDMSDVNVSQPLPDLAILTYIAKQDMSCEGENSPTVASTAVYVRQGGKWRWASYQETPVK